MSEVTEELLAKLQEAVNTVAESFLKEHGLESVTMCVTLREGDSGWTFGACKPDGTLYVRQASASARWLLKCIEEEEAQRERSAT